MPFLIKTVVSALVIAGVSELTKRSPMLASVLASLPLTSLLAFVWTYRESGTDAVLALSTGIFWMILPSLVLFLALPLLVKTGLKFYPALGVSCALTALVYAGYAALLGRFGVRI